MKIWLGPLAAASISTACIAGATDNETYDTIFRSGTLDALPEASVIEYAETGGVADQTLRLTIGSENLTELVRIRGQQRGAIGQFPTDVGNPLIMYYMENAVRAVAEKSGGSPFYIRNRFKEALLDEAEHEPVLLILEGIEVSGERLVLHPLEGDVNAEAAGFDDLALEVTVSPDVPGWYYSLAVSGGGEPAAVSQRIEISDVEQASE
ncbi:hypothetical protein [Amaricoccus macauensis]|uniref:hypothetical protein n=1 Tax=Amaricoccus macauensis TaxID=57001 RepID=UPI003C7C6F4C